MDHANNHKNYIVPTYPFRGKTFLRGDGYYLYDDKDEKYLDLMNNYGTNIFGYNHPTITKALQEQISRLINIHGSFASDVRNSASKKLVQVCGGKLNKVYWSNSGSEAIEVAIKFAVATSEKNNIIAAKNGFHGKTLGALALNSNKKYRGLFEPLLFSVTHVPYGDAQKIKEAINQDTGAVILEPIQGEGGIILPPKGYLKKVEEICKKKGVLFIIDEIQTGAGRTGAFLSCHQENIEPDIVCLGKGLGGGIPIGVTLVSSELANKIPRGIHTSTFGGNPLACSGVNAVLKLLDNKTYKNIKEVGEYFISELKKINTEEIVEVRGKGLMIGVEVKSKITPVLKSLQDKKILASPAGENVVRFLPAYTIGKAEITEAIEVLTHVFKK